MAVRGKVASKAHGGAVALRHPGKFRYVRRTGTPYANRRIAMPLAVTGYPKADDLTGDLVVAV